MRPIRPTFATSSDRWAIQVTDDNSRTLIDCSTNVAFHSASGAAAETQHVYLKNSGVADHIAKQQPTRVLEIGLGTGMAMLMTMDLAQTNHAPLQYVAIESDWLQADVLQQLNLQDVVSESSLLTKFLQLRRSLGADLPSAIYRWSASDLHHLTVYHMTAQRFLQQSEESRSFDAVFFDPFAPSVCPELWQTDFLACLQPLLKSDGKLVTYCVNRAVRESFMEAGFEVERVAGPVGGKREVLIAAPRREAN